MLGELVMDLLTAADPKDKERAYRRFEKVGVDRRTADLMAAEFYKEQGGGGNEIVDERSR
ncbi:hypothetical protein [Flintibacter porci]|uniref:hypothetical protein n=1 Tax=Flintibacter porci TaxID=3342383 RepID=UPI003F89ED4F